MLKSILDQQQVKYKISMNFVAHIVLLIFLSYLSTSIFSQPKYTWNLEPSPIYSNLKNLQIIDDTAAIVLSN